MATANRAHTSRRRSAEPPDRPLEDGQAYPASALRPALQRSERVTYTDNGNRSVAAAEALRRVAPLLGRCGITRVADVSRLSYDEFPVFQSCRPNIWGHPSRGQNTGSQGKGASPAQAKISCIMETIEGYCAEPRQAALVRGAYNQLRGHNVIVDPRRFVARRGIPRVRLDEPIAWTEVYSVELDRCALVPAEAVFFPFHAEELHTRPHFPCWSNGLASGSTVLEAVIHGLYEVIERYFLALWERGEVAAYVVDLDERDLLSASVTKVVRQVRDSLAVQILLLKRPREPQPVTVAVCRLEHRLWSFSGDGFGCSSLPEVAIERAFSEAMQGTAVVASGAREDLARPAPPIDRSARGPRPAASPEPYWPAARRFRDLRDEYRFLVKEIHRLGFPNVFIANFMRAGLEVPVVKVLVPEMRVRSEIAIGRSLDVHAPGSNTRQRFAIDADA